MNPSSSTPMRSNPLAVPEPLSGFLPAGVLTAASPLPLAQHIGPRQSARRLLTQRRSIPDVLFGLLLLGCALSLFAILGLILIALLHGARLSVVAFGAGFFTHTVWNPVLQRFGVVAFLWGTVISSSVALLLAAPAALGVAIFTLEMCPRPLRGTLGFLTELLAAVPGVVYGLWALLVLVPAMREYIGPALQTTLGWTRVFAGPSYGVGVLSASIVLAIMIFPVITAVSRDVMGAVARDQTEAVLALGGTRWEAIRTGILRNARLGIAGSLVLGLGRALGETMATAMIIGNHPALFRSLLAPGYTMASVLANEFAEAAGDLHLSALTEVGLTLLLLTALVNALARLLVWFVVRGRREYRGGRG